MKKKPVRDIGSLFLSHHHTILPRLKAHRGYDYDLYVADGSEPDKLLLSGKIDVNEHATLLAFVVILHKANMLGPKGPAYEKSSHSGMSNLADRMAESLSMVNRISSVLDTRVGRSRRTELVNLCMSEKNMADIINTKSLKKSIFALREALDEARFGVHSDV